MAYKYCNTIKNGAEILIDGIKNIEMFLDDKDEWNFHDSEIASFGWDKDKKTFTVTIELYGCDYPNIEWRDSKSTVLLDFHFEDCIEIHMNHVDLHSQQIIQEIEISKFNDYIECCFNGYPIRVTSKRLRINKPRVANKN